MADAQIHDIALARDALRDDELEVQSAGGGDSARVLATTLGFPPATTTQRNAMTPAAGWAIFNTTLGKAQICTNATGPVWETITSAV